MRRMLALGLVLAALAGCAPKPDDGPLTPLRGETANPLAAPPQAQDPNGGAP